MSYPPSGSIIDPGQNTTLSTHITVKVGPTTVGAIQSLSVSQTRDILVHEEIGTDGVVDSHPKNAAKIDIQVERIVFDQLRLTEAFARGFINLQAQRFPFDIQIMDRSMHKNASIGSVLGKIQGVGNIIAGASFQGITNLADAVNIGFNTYNDIRNAITQNVTVHTLHNCWFKNYTPTFTANNFIISEKAALSAERVTTHRAGANAAEGGLRGISFEYDDIERNTDLYGRQGRFDPHVINVMNTWNQLKDFTSKIGEQTSQLGSTISNLF